MNDLIYRQDAIGIADDLRDYISVDGYWAWIERLKSLPAAQPDLSEYSDNLWRKAYEQGKAAAQPKRIRGRWEIYIISMFDGEGCKCSECGFEGAPYWDFCPNCGADMRDRDGTTE